MKTTRFTCFSREGLGHAVNRQRYPGQSSKVSSNRTLTVSTTMVMKILLTIGILAIPVAPAIASSEGDQARHLIVQFEDGVTVEDERLGLIQDGAINLFALRRRGLYAVEVMAESKITLINRFGKIRGVRVVEVDVMGHGGLEYSDELFPLQWHLEQDSGIDVNATSLWSVTRGSPDVVVAVLDSGLYLDHPEFEGRLVVVEPINGIDDDDNGFVDDTSGWDFVNHTNDPEDVHGHGSQVTAVLGANENGFSGIGIDNLVSLLPVRVLDEFNRGYTSDLIDALYYVAELGVDVINLSLVGYPASSVLLDEALHYARMSGAILISCAGNSGPETADFQYPGAHPDTISVSTTNSVDGLADFSSTGLSVDLSAPGLDIITTDTDPPFDSSVVYSSSGCSFATPIVSGIVSLLRSMDARLTQDEAINILAMTAVDLGESGWDASFGFGRVDGYAAVLELQRRLGAPRETAIMLNGFE